MKVRHFSECAAQSSNGLSKYKTTEKISKRCYLIPIKFTPGLRGDPSNLKLSLHSLHSSLQQTLINPNLHVLSNNSNYPEDLLHCSFQLPEFRWQWFNSRAVIRFVCLLVRNNPAANHVDLQAGRYFIVREQSTRGLSSLGEAGRDNSVSLCSTDEEPHSFGPW